MVELHALAAMWMHRDAFSHAPIASYRLQPAGPIQTHILCLQQKQSTRNFRELNLNHLHNCVRILVPKTEKAKSALDESKTKKQTPQSVNMRFRDSVFPSSKYSNKTTHGVTDDKEII